jgi:hypothetical protein
MNTSKISFFITLLFVSVFAFSGAQSLNIPPASPQQTLTQQFATSKIEISYFRPSARDRVVFGDVVPFDKLWRTGANSASTIYFGEDVTIDGKELPKGKYGLLSIPGKSEWILILSKDTTVTSERAYKQENDALRLTVKPVSLTNKVETFTISVDNIKNNEADIVLSWENTAVSFTVKADIDAKIMKEIDEVMGKDTRPYYQAASYYFNNNKDMNKALEWVNKAIEARPDAFWMTHMKAKILLNLNRLNEAVDAAELSKKQAQAISYEEYVKMNDALLAEIKARPGYKPAKKK